MTAAPVLQLLLSLLALDATLTNTCPARIPGGPQATADTQEPTGTVVQPESILVRRDLSVQTPVVVQAIGPDGVLLANGTHIPWFDVLVGQNWAWAAAATPSTAPNTNTPPAPPSLTNREIQIWQQTFGQPWFLIRSRVARGETFEVLPLLAALSQGYTEHGSPSVGAVALHYYRSQLFDQAGDPTAAALEWLAAQTSQAELWLDDKSTSFVDWDGRLQQYLNPADFPIDPIAGVPFHAPPRWEHWTETERTRWREWFDQTRGWPRPTDVRSPSGTAEAPTGTSSPTTQAQTLVALYGLAAAAQYRDLETLDRASELLELASRRLEGPAAANKQRLLAGLIESARRIRACLQDPNQWNDSGGLRDYLELETEWLQSLSRNDGPGLQLLTWEVYLQGLALRSHPDPSAQAAGQIQQWLLRHWTERYPEVAGQIPLLQPRLWQPLLQTLPTDHPRPTR